MHFFRFICIMPQYDYLIVGQGLAGSCLAMQLLGRKKSVLVVDRADAHSASRVAAGLFNPVTSKVRVPTWLAEQLFPQLEMFYTRMESLLGVSFFYPRTLYRPFPSAADALGWERAENPFIRQIHLSSAYGSQVKDPHGGIELQSSGYCDTRVFIEAVRHHLIERNALVDADLTMENISTTEQATGHFEKMGWSARRIIWCEGIGINRNPLFRWLPVNPLKGEVMLVKSDLPESPLFNRGVYLVPDEYAGEKIFRAGATHDRSSVPGNTDEGLSELRFRLDQLLTVPYQQLGSDWGFRPTVPDRRPILGPHPESDTHWIFNGLGTKGVSLAPFFSAQLADAVESGASLTEDVNIRRFYPLYFKSLQTAARK